MEAGCVTIPQLDTSMNAVVVSPDSLNVYVRGHERLMAFDRAADGALTLKAGNAGCFTETVATNCTDAAGLVGWGYEMAVSPRGSQLYVSNERGVAIFNRGAGGTLSQAGDLTRCVTRDGSSTGPSECSSLGGGLASESTMAVTISPSGKHVFISGTYGSVVFARSAATGTLAMTDCIAWQDVPGCQDLDATGGSVSRSHRTAPARSSAPGTSPGSGSTTSTKRLAASPSFPARRAATRAAWPRAAP